ncbi:MAG: hypothetical protein Fur0037_29130 [Planctomycetota bacterium]
MDLSQGLISLAWVPLASVGAPAWLGWSIVRRAAPSASRRAALAFGYLIGQFAMAHVTLLWLIADQPFPGALLPLIGAATAIAIRGARPPAIARRAMPPLPVLIPLAFVLLSLLDAFTQTNALPVRFGDEADIWAAKAKVLFCSPGFHLSAGLHSFVSHPDYPLWNPLVQVLSFASAGSVLHWENRMPIQAFAIALALLLSESLERRASPLVAGLELLAFAGTTFASSANACTADVMLALSALAAVEALLRHRDSQDSAFWALGCVCLAALLASKNEGSLVAIAIALPFAIDRWIRLGTRGVFGKGIFWLALPLASIALHRGFNAYFGCTNDLFDPGVRGGLFGRVIGNLPERSLPVARFYAEMLVDPERQRWILLAFLIAAAALAGARRAAPRILLAICGIALAGYMLVFVGTHADLEWHMLTAADRTVLHVLPLAAVGLAACLGEQASGSRPPQSA